MGARSDFLIQQACKYSARNYSPIDVVLERGEGCWVYDVEQKRFLDFLGAYSAVNFGHRNPRLIAAAEEQLKKLTLCSRAFHNDQAGPFCEELADLCGMEVVLPMNSGAEAVEAAIKTSRKWAYDIKGVEKYKAEIVVFEGNFHGRTTTVISFSSTGSAKEGFGPFTPGFVSVPFGDIEALKSVINQNTAAVLIEPIQGEAGIILPPDGFLRKVRELCSKENVIMIADEIQTGLCRTGEIFACDHEQVKPDMILLGKALGGSITPISALVSRWDFMQVLTPGIHGSTFGGNPFACAIAREVIKIIKEESPQKNAKILGQYLLQELENVESDRVEAMRGRGLFVGIDLKPQYGSAIDVCYELKERGVLTKDTKKQTIRIAPPLIITRPELDWGIGRIKEALQSAAKV